jgi:hypothetical protein
MPMDVRGMAPLLAVFDMATSIKFYCDILTLTATSSAFSVERNSGLQLVSQ